MSTNSGVKLGEYFTQPNPSLKSYLGRVKTGNDEEYRTPFYAGKSLHQILEDWLPYLEQVKDQWPELYDFEIDLAEKVGPLSIQKPLKDRMDDIGHYYEDILLPSKPISTSALAAVKKEWEHVAGMQIRSQEKTVDNMRKSTNSGSPYFTKRRDVVDETIPSKVTVIDNVVYQELGHDVWKAVAVLGWRGQEGGPEDDDVKQRVVWMFPFAVNITELQVYQPLIEEAQRFQLVPAWISMESVDERITRMFDTKGKDDLVICTDFSKFDQHFNADMQNGAKSILTHILADGDQWLKDVFPVKYVIPLVADEEHIFQGPHGMGSGSGGTNADETLVHRALQYEAAIQHNAKLNLNSQCLGDDGVLTYPGITVEDVVDTYTSHGQEMNVTKQYASTHDCVYLRRWHHERYRVNNICVGVYSTARALGRLCEQERFYDPKKWSKEMVELRYLSILENVKYHPLREQFVQWCMKGDIYRLGLDIPGFLPNIQQYADKAINYMPDFLGYTKSMQKDASAGIADWWIVKYLQSLS